jgi:hypothetical protein
MGWMANTDIQPCTGEEGVVAYLGKYAAKAEKASDSYKDLFSRVLPFVNEERAALSLISKVMNKLVGERDWSAQEVSHLLLNLPLCNSTRSVINVDCRPESAQSTAYFYEQHEDGQQVNRRKSYLQKYKGRPPALEEVTYLDFLMHYDLKRYHKRPRAKARALNYIPRYRQSDQPDDFARVKPMLHHPFHNIEKLKEIDGETHASYEEAYQNRLLNYGGLHWIDSFGNADLPDDPTESEFEPSPVGWPIKISWDALVDRFAD